MLEIHVGQSSPCLHHIQTYAVQHHQHCNIKGRSLIDFKRKGINKITRFANIYYQNNSNLLLSCFLTNLICILFTNDSNLLLSIFLFLNFSKYFFGVRLLSVLCGHSVFPSPPQRPMTSDFEGFSIPDFIHYIIFYLNSSERAVISLFNVEYQTRELLVPFL